MDYELINGEKVASHHEMPELWRMAIDSGALNHVPDIDFISMRLRRFYYAMSVERDFSVEARQVVDFYAGDWRKESYPNFIELKAIAGSMEDGENRMNIISAAEVIFGEFGYWMPASFYMVLVAPAFRDFVGEMRMLRFSEVDALSARGWDASLHAFGKTFDIANLVQAVSSQHGFLVSHGCDCSHKTTEITATSEPHFYQFESDEQKWAQVMAYWWHMWWEFAVFSIQPNTQVGSLYRPSVLNR